LIPNKLAKNLEGYLLGSDSFEISTKEKKTFKIRRRKKKEKKRKTFKRKRFKSLKKKNQLSLQQQLTSKHQDLDNGVGACGRQFDDYDLQ